MNVFEILTKVSSTVKERGTERDLPSGERSMARCVLAFNSLTNNNLKESDGWIFMMLLKLSRMREGKFKEDDVIDTTGYSALLAECAIKENNGS